MKKDINNLIFSFYIVSIIFTCISIRLIRNLSLSLYALNLDIGNIVDYQSNIWAILICVSLGFYIFKKDLDLNFQDKQPLNKGFILIWIFG